jgi:hypothetical protein
MGPVPSNSVGGTETLLKLTTRTQAGFFFKSSRVRQWMLWTVTGAG